MEVFTHARLKREVFKTSDNRLRLVFVWRRSHKVTREVFKASDNRLRFVVGWRCSHEVKKDVFKTPDNRLWFVSDYDLFLVWQHSHDVKQEILTLDNRLQFVWVCSHEVR